MFIDLNFGVGQCANGTGSQARGRWHDANLVRTPDGPDLQPVGGWVRFGAGTLTGSARAGIAWTDNSSPSVRRAGFGTHSNLFAASVSGALTDITPSGFTVGRADATTGGGYGAGTYGSAGYGTARSDSSTVNPASVWTLDTWGQYLIGCMGADDGGDGKVYQWNLNNAVIAAVVTNAPTGCNGLSVAADRFLFVYLGKTVQWCDQGDNTVWTPSATNQAGSLAIDTQGTFKCGRKIPGAHLHFTEVDVWRSRYINAQVVHGFDKIGSGCGIVSKGCIVAIDARVVWMSTKSFFLYNNGFLQPVESEVADKVFANFNSQQQSKVTAFHNPQYSEVWWFYPSANSTENDSYVFWNYRDNHWWTGTLSRTLGIGQGVFRYPIMADPSGLLYQHEQGFNWSGIVPYARSAPIEWPTQMGSWGDQRSLVKGFAADEKTPGDTRVTMYGRPFPGGAETAYGPFAIATPATSQTGFTDCCVNERQVEFKIEFIQPAASRAGIYRLDAKPISSR